MDSNDLIIADQTIKLGQTKDFNFKISETVLGDPVTIPIKIIRAKEPGPTLLVMAGIHGDEMNGVAIVRELMINPPKLIKGSLILMPIINIFGFEENSRYLPDRRDLNRCFPGSNDGPLGSRIAFLLTNEIIKKSSMIIDLHTGAFPRTNYPHIRADLSNQMVKKLANSFYCELILDTKGEKSTLRNWASKQNVPTICYEAGETNRFESNAIQSGLNGINNVLLSFKMILSNFIKSNHTHIIKQSVWVRSGMGGILEFHVSLGDYVKKGDVIASCLALNSSFKHRMIAPKSGVVLGLVTRPTIKPGEPLCHIACISKPSSSKIKLQ